MQQQKTVFSEGEKEQARWEMLERDVPRGLQPGRPYRENNEPGLPGSRYPKMLYKVQRLDNGKWCAAVGVPPFFGFRDANEWDRACQRAMDFNKSCQLIVNNEAEHDRAKEEGWRDTAPEAEQFQAALDKMVSDEAGARNYRDRNMSEKALAERDKIESEHFGHLGEIPEQPIVRRVKKDSKSKTAAA